MAKCGQCGKLMCRDPYHKVANAQSKPSRNDKKIAAHDEKTARLAHQQRARGHEHKGLSQKELNEVKSKHSSAVDQIRRLENGTYEILWKRGKKPSGY